PTRVEPAIGPWGFDLAGMDRSVAPGDDFDRYANGGWLARTRIPNDQEASSTMLMLTERGQEWTREVIESAGGAPGTDGQRVADYYRSFMDEASIDAAGIAPIQPRLDQIAAIHDAPE